MKRNEAQQKADIIWKSKGLFVGVPVLLVAIVSVAGATALYNNYAGTHGKVVDDFSFTSATDKATAGTTASYSAYEKKSYTLDSFSTFAFKEDNFKGTLTNMKIIDDGSPVVSGKFGTKQSAYFLAVYSITPTVDFTGSSVMSYYQSDKEFAPLTFYVDNTAVTDKTVWKKGQTYKVTGVHKIQSRDYAHVVLGDTSFVLEMVGE